VRVGGLIRVSTDEQAQGGYSLDAQRAAILRYCAGQGWDEPGFYVESVSGWTDDIARRPVFSRLLDDARSGAVEAIVVWKLDRFARNLIVAVRELNDLHRRGVRFVSLTESIDLGSPFGRAMAAIIAIFAELASDQTSERTSFGLAQKRAGGLHIGGVPYGAVRVEGRLVVDPARAGDLAALLALCAHSGIDRVAQELNARAIPAARGGRWHGASVREVVLHGAWLADQPDPWPDRWRAAAARPPLPPVRGDRRVRMLSGLMRCGACGGRIGYRPANRSAGQADDYTICRNWGARPGGYRCPNRRCGVSIYHAQVVEQVAGLPDLRGRRRRHTDTGAARAELAERRVRLGERYSDLTVTREEYRRELAAIQAAEARLPPAGGAWEALGEAMWAGQRAFASWPAWAQNEFLRLYCDEVTIAGRLATVVWNADIRALMGAPGVSQSQ
jgi:DNA invertase Pin-like site-specific DNA recombinase